MSKIIVLGGYGAVGRVAVRTLVKHAEFSEVVIGDFNVQGAQQLAAGLDSPKVTAVQFNAMDPRSVSEAIQGCDIVLNCVGPFYTTVKPILSAVVESRIDYVDVCDDVDVTLDILGMDQIAREAGITAVIGMGNSPGVTNLLGKLAAETLLEETDAVDIFHAHGGEPIEGEGVIEHRFHCMSIDIPMFIEGELKYVKYFEEDGIALRTTFQFPILGEVPVYPYPHPEQITMPKYIQLKRVTNRGSVIPNEYYDLIREMCRLGLNSKEPLVVKGRAILPYDFAIAYIIRERERILKDTHFGSQRGCTSVVVKGKKNGKYKEYRFHMASQSQALGEGTGIPAAMGAILVKRGKVPAKGIMPPEACINPYDFLALLPEIMALEKRETGGLAFEGFLVESVDENGNVKKVDLQLG
jgi:saccharopine dehydrogenase-like NADP-dependent oxidoreductase